MFFFFKQKTAYEMRISDWSSDVCSSDLAVSALGSALTEEVLADLRGRVVDGVTGRPIGEVEQDGVADALTRATADVEAITDALRRGVPRLGVAALTVVGTGVALALVAPELAAAAVVGVGVAVPAVR